MTFLPGWDSPEFVRTAHRDLEFVSIVGFVLCAACEFVKHVNPSHGKLIGWAVIGSFLFAAFMELIAFPYGERNDELAREQASKQDFAISELSVEAQKALDSAKAAIEDSNAATSKAAGALTLSRGARQEADSFERDIVAAKKQATDAEAHLAEALLRAARAEKSAAEVSDKLADRVLDDRQATEIAAALRPYGEQEFDITTYEDSREPLALSNRLLKILDAGGWKYIPPTAWRGLFGGVTGVQLWRHPEADQRTKDAADALLSALSNRGIQAELRVQNPTNNPKHNRISLTVGEKPR
jgi:hypothetical protein